MRLSPKYQNVNRALIRLDGRVVVSVGALRVADFGQGTKSAPVVPKEGERSGVRGAEAGDVVAVRVLCSEVELSPAVFNEEYLAHLRDFLKTMETEEVDAIIVPITDNIAVGDVGGFAAAMVHTARRIKDCASVVGFALPDAVASDAQSVSDFIEAMSAKHPQYVYFCACPTSDERLIPYGLRKKA